MVLASHSRVIVLRPGGLVLDIFVYPDQEPAVSISHLRPQKRLALVSFFFLHDLAKITYVFKLI